MKNNFLKKGLCLTMISAMVLAMSGCGGSSSSADVNSDAEFASLKFSLQPQLHSVPVYYEDMEGDLAELFGEYTIDVYSSGPVQNEAIPSGAWEAGTTATGGAILGAAGYDLKVIGFTSPDETTISAWVREGSELADMEPDEMGVRGTADDWRGKTIMCQTGTSAHMMLIATLEHLGLTLDDIDLIDTTVANAYTAYLAGEADIVCLWEPYLFSMESEGGTQIANSALLGLNQPCMLVATADALENNRDAVKAWVELYYQTTAELIADPDLNAQLIYDYQNGEGLTCTIEDATRLAEAKPYMTFEENVELFTPDADGTIEAEEILLVFAKFFEGQGKISSEEYARIAANQIVDESIILELAAE